MEKDDENIELNKNRERISFIEEKLQLSSESIKDFPIKCNLDDLKTKISKLESKLLELNTGNS